VWRDGAGGSRLLIRRPVAVHRGPRYRLRRAVAGLAVVVASAAAVVALGLLARAAGSDAVAPTPAPTVVTSAPGDTVWEVAARLAPGRPGPEVAALAERLVTENGLTSARLRPGQVLRVTSG
jgi:Tfp pilus assembly protein FimV